MQQQSDSISKMRAITISREYGSGGGEIAQRLAQRLGWQLVDHEIVVQVARELEVSEEEVEAHDEYSEGITARILSSLQSMQPAMFAISPAPAMTNTEGYQEALNRVVQGALATGHVVIVGRGGQVLLHDHRDVLHTRIVAPLEQRIIYVMRREGTTRDEARNRVQVKDQDRHRYLQNVYRQHPNDPHLYDIILNTGVLTLDQAVDLIILALQQKSSRLALPIEELGPGAGLARYASQPRDLRLPPDINKPPTR
jgi:CMP/dCMP kinase